MSIIKSISGIRGTIGGTAGENLTPEDIVQSTAAYGTWLNEQKAPPLVVIGRDARISGYMVTQLVSATLQAVGIDVIDLGLSTTPTVEMAVTKLNAGGGIILTASHNPKEWNALKLLNQKGEFISAADGQRLLDLIKSGQINYAQVDDLGKYETNDDMLDYHVHAVLEHPLVAAEKINDYGFKVVVDAVNSSGAIAIPALLEELGCQVILLNGEPNGEFAHNPEPLPQHLEDLRRVVDAEKADLGVAVDPDVDRLALVGPGGQWIGEEYTLVAVADYVLQHQKGTVVSNLSSSRALGDIAQKYGCDYHASAVGEVNVVAKMKETKAVIGGEGNGGIIDPMLHYGRDSLIGVALVLSHMVTSEKTINELRNSYPQYEMVKDKLKLDASWNVDQKLQELIEKYKDEKISTIDGLKIDFEDGWVHLRKSNTEPIIRIYAEANNSEKAQQMADQIKNDFL